MSRFISPFLFGLASVPLGLKAMLSISGLKRWALAPWLLGLISVFAYYSQMTLFVRLASDQIKQSQFFLWIQGLSLFNEGALIPLDFLLGGLEIILFITLFFLGIFVMLLIVQLLAFPFYTLMVEKAYAFRGKPSASGIKIQLKMILTSLRKLALFGPLILFLAIASFFPGINILAFALLYLLLAIDLADPSFEVEGLSLKERLQEIRKNLPYFIGSTLSLILSSLVPGLSLVLLPFMVLAFAEYRLRDGGLS